MAALPTNAADSWQSQGIDSIAQARIGQQIFQNECAGRRECLVHWNVGEAFPSLGIGHFIWYPKGMTEPYVESFPSLVRFLADKEPKPPTWVLDALPKGAPWADRAEFLADRDSLRQHDLLSWLEGSVAGQAAFLSLRLVKAKPSLIAAWKAEATPYEPYLRLFESLRQRPQGLYAMTDYVNFKGEGLSQSERYQGQGWGLKQVLEQAAGQAACERALDEGRALPQEQALSCFRLAAANVLSQRVENSPSQREVRWLAGWLKRIDSYR